MKKNIQCISHGLIVSGSKILVYDVEDKVKKKTFFRLIGGHIEFGESASEALKREFKEEIDQEIEIICKLDTFENIFVYKGSKQHEFVSLFKVEFLNKDIYNSNVIVGQEGPDRTFEAKWIEVSEFRNNKKVLYPPEVLSYLSK